MDKGSEESPKSSDKLYDAQIRIPEDKREQLTETERVVLTVFDGWGKRNHQKLLTQVLEGRNLKKIQVEPIDFDPLSEENIQKLVKEINIDKRGKFWCFFDGERAYDFRNFFPADRGKPEEIQILVENCLEPYRTNHNVIRLIRQVGKSWRLKSFTSISGSCNNLRNETSYGSAKLSSEEEQKALADVWEGLNKLRLYGKQ